MRLIFALGGVAILRSVFNENPDMYAFGSKWQTLFGNEYCSLLFFPPLFAYLATIPLNITYLNKINYRYMFWGALCILILKYPLAPLLLCAAVFYPYVKRDYRIFIGVAVLQTIIGATTGENTTRAYFLYLAFSLVAYILVYVIKRIFITRAFCVVCIILPFLLFLPMLSIQNIYEESFFEKTQTYVTGKTEDEEFATDTRTFLYLEMTYDLTKTKSWLWGKGAYAHYYSDWFDDGGVNGKYGRIASEVPFLNFLMHGGIVYTSLYFLLLAYAVYNGLWKSNNKFVQCIAVVATAWFFCSFVCDLTGARYYHMVFFMLLGCCFSKHFLSMSDEKVVLFFGEGAVV